ncbi:hypothetical protein CJD_A0251 [Clostridium perfringens D str. JGS1721]|uniref:Uncharacterized protein n=1 Tax=Clostridium perfringens D str. JGS1721 TaxID=488537 RepID=B1V6Y7_CLOPF|nr:hypothetical protein [Clostridium perfringens]EDT70189.1 hypothetical protein CJD_A0616 [Clostridium perfringens D str. JGS1721]EDT70378.1 hypothetical protein CJD_A0236 [Clostridium perfringens D str. JGS1721]EDT70426.1 hypothetical protein CJD_A0251 [Clostridium perfringens D str. JGS1721]
MLGDLLKSNIALIILLPISNKKINRFISYTIMMYRIEFYNILKDNDKLYKKLLKREQLNERELKYLNENIL